MSYATQVILDLLHFDGVCFNRGCKNCPIYSSICVAAGLHDGGVDHIAFRLNRLALVKDYICENANIIFEEIL